MAITVVGSALAADTGSGTVDTITMPAGIAAGDGALLFFGYASGGTTTTLTDNGLSTPFTQVGATATFSGHQSQLWSAQNLAAADSGKVITMTQSAGVRQGAFVVVYRGASKTAMVNASASRTSTLLSATAVTTPTVTTTAAGCVELAFMCATRGSTTPQIATITPPAGSTVGATSASPALGAAVTTQAVVAWEGRNLSAAASGVSLGGDVYTIDQGAPYSAWTVALAPASTGPIVDAGADQTVTAGSVVTLSGTESAATGTTISSRAWTALTYPGTTAPTITGGTTATATFTTAATGGVYTFRYRVTDSAGIFNDSTVTVNATTATGRPIATASAGAWVPGGGATTLHGALADDVDTTWAEVVNPSSASFTVNLPPAPVGAKTVSYRLQVDPATPGTGTYLVEYLNGGNAAVVASKTETVTTSILAGSFVLTDAQNSALTNPNTHQLRFTATAA
jgi:hypothetical protein